MTIKELFIELNKFPKEASVTPYTGEVEGITIGGVDGKYGFIYTEDDEKETELLN